MATEERVIEGDDVKDEISGSVEVSFRTNIGPIRRKSNRNKKVECKVCFKTMRIDNLKRHMKQHKNLYLMDEDERYQEMCYRKQLHKEREKQQLMIDAIAHEMDVPRECIEQDSVLNGLKPLPTVDDEELRHRLSLGQREYEQTLELGKKIYGIVGEGNVKVQSLSKHDKEALDTYIKQKPNRDYTDIILRS